MAEEKVSRKAWGQFSESDYDLQQWWDACLIHLVPKSEYTSKEQCKLPIREPDGTLNENGVIAATIRIGQTKAPRELIRKAAKELIKIYKDILQREPPESLYHYAGLKPPKKDSD